MGELHAGNPIRVVVAPPESRGEVAGLTQTADGSAVEGELATAEPPGGVLCGGATQRVS